MRYESPPVLRTVRKAATTADGQSWYRKESFTPASSRSKWLNWLSMVAPMCLR
jgi:hypothetical protein